MEVTSGMIFKADPYYVVAGKAKDDDTLNHYMVINENFNVVEYETEILPAAIAWATHFSMELAKLLAPVDGSPKKESIPEQNVLPFPAGKPN